MNSNHILSIIPMTMAVVLLALGLGYGSYIVQASAAVMGLYGLAIHANNVRIHRRSTYSGYNTEYL